VLGFGEPLEEHRQLSRRSVEPRQFAHQKLEVEHQVGERIVDFVRDAFGHLKAIAADEGAQALLKTANIGHDAGVVSANDETAFIAAAKTRQWSREKSVRTLA